MGETLRAEVRLAARTGIGDELNRHANDLSAGKKQRLAICQALLPGPKLLLADEAIWKERLATCMLSKSPPVREASQ